MRTLSETKLYVRAWLASWWPRRAAARELARQYRVIRENAPAALADLLRAGCYFDSTVGATSEQTLINTGKRELALHLVAMMNISPEDLRHLQERTDQDE